MYSVVYLCSNVLYLLCEINKTGNKTFELLTGNKTFELVHYIIYSKG